MISVKLQPCVAPHSPVARIKTIRVFLFYALILPAVLLALLAVFRVRFARRIWKRLYILGLVYVAVILGRVAYLVLF